MANKSEKEKKHFFRNFKAELKKVIWPTPKQVVNNTVAVVSVVLITAVIVLVLDLAFDGLNNFGINKLKTVLNPEASVHSENEANTDAQTNGTEDLQNANNENPVNVEE